MTAEERDAVLSRMKHTAKQLKKQLPLHIQNLLNYRN